MRSGFACDNDDDEERQLEYFSTEQTSRENATFISSRFRKERASPSLSLFFFFFLDIYSWIHGVGGGKCKATWGFGNENSKKVGEIRRSMKHRIHFP